MSARDYIGKPGIESGVWIDGVNTLVGPKVWSLRKPPRQALFQAMNQTHTITSAYDGDGLPVVLDNLTVEFPFSLFAGFESLAAQLEILETAGGIHTLAVRKANHYTYQLRAGQVTFWMRGDASAQGFAGFSDGLELDADILIPTSSVPHPTTVYQTLVTSGDSVPAGEVWISRTLTKHPTSGKYLAFCKLGTAPTAPATMTTAHFQLFRVVVTEIPRTYPQTGVEEMVLMMAETN